MFVGEFPQTAPFDEHAATLWPKSMLHMYIE